MEVIAQPESSYKQLLSNTTSYSSSDLSGSHYGGLRPITNLYPNAIMPDNVRAQVSITGVGVTQK